MRKRLALLVIAVVAILLATPFVSAAQLKGWCFYMYLNVTGAPGTVGDAQIYIYDNLGNKCGEAKLAAVGTAVNTSTVAYQSNMLAMLSDVPYTPTHIGAWFTDSGFCASTCPQRDGCPVGTFSGNLKSYYLSVF